MATTAFLHPVAEMTLQRDDERDMLDWEKANAVEHVRKDNITKKETMDNRVIAINKT